MVIEISQFLKSDQDSFKSLFDIWKNSLKKQELTEDLVKIISSIKYIYCKKLSTGFDEDLAHKALLKKLTENVKRNEELLICKKQELEALKKTKQESTQQFNEEIERLKEELRKLKKEEDFEVERLKQEYEEKQKQKKHEYKSQKKILNDMIKKIKEELVEQEKQNFEAELSLKKQ